MTTVAGQSIQRLLDDAMQAARGRLRVPAATYRLQMHAHFTLRNAIEIVPYLDRLGISHVYVSSLLTARPGSLHGYDVMNHAQLNPEIGTEDDLSALVTELHRRDMGLIIDVVPNHMWIGEGNEWWMDVLENGPTSRFAGYFDIAWRNPPRERLKGKVLLPILDEPYGKAIQAGRLQPFFEHGRIGLKIDQTRLPIDLRTYAFFIDPALQALRSRCGDEAMQVLELQSISTAIKNLPPRETTDADQLADAAMEAIVIKRRLRDLAHQNAEVAEAIQHVVDEMAAAQHHPCELTRLIDLLEAQCYRPCFWRVALDEINYRRFFDINDLAALAAERIDVFQATHIKPFEWLTKGLVDGLRIDHVDGLLDPQEYLVRLQQQYLLGCAQTLCEAAPEKYDVVTWPETAEVLQSELEVRHPITEPILYVVVEKILGPRESLPAKWICHGTTGYEFTNYVNSLFVNAERADEMTSVYRRFTGQSASFEHVAYEDKLQILRSTMASELHVLAHRLDHLAQMEWWSRDFTLNGLRHALEEMIACFPVYRTYVAAEASSTDRSYILRAARNARKRSPYLGREIFDFICDTLLLRVPEGITVSADYHLCQRKFLGKFQQLTSPVMAKGVEDTALYTFNRLLSLNEVGGEPAKFGRTPEELHTFFEHQSDLGLHGLSPLSTHDTKRSEDVRARINVLSEMPEEWSHRILEWRRMNKPFKVELSDGTQVPDDNEEYFLYQTLLGTWPDHLSCVDATFVERIQRYMTKVVREAKVNSSWIYPEIEYDDAVSSFVSSILDQGKSAAFLSDLQAFHQVIDPLGKLNSLSQSLIRCTAPGVPDTYQGTETWDYSLVDPDNRRPVDYTSHSQMLDELVQPESDTATSRLDWVRRVFKPENAKFFVTAQALRIRRKLLDLFIDGKYTALESTGPDAQHLFGFLRFGRSKTVLIAVPRLIGALHTAGKVDCAKLQVRLDASLSLPDAWSQEKWSNCFSRTECRARELKLPAADLFSDLPVALLSCERGE